MTTKEATAYCMNKMRSLFEASEASQVTDWVMEHITGSAKTERMLYKDALITQEEETTLHAIINRLLQQEPLQYVLNEAWFCGLRFYVDKHVLIPRPETEELVEWIISNCKFPIDELTILDIGTGSGCIPIALKRRIRKTTVWACDISKDALDIAKKNAAALGAAVEWRQLDILDKSSWDQLPVFDIIISNPPYIPEREASSMEANVVEFEPSIALFVPDNDPLVFYRAIAEFGKTHLSGKGTLYMEIHENLGDQVIQSLAAMGYQSEMRKDMQQKDRMIKSGLH